MQLLHGLIHRVHLAYIATEALEATSLPPLEMAEKMSFEDRISASIKLAANKGLDFYFGITVALVAIGERISQQVGNVNIFSMLSQPRALLRFARGMIRAKMAGRKLLPKDIWSIRGAICTGTDAEIFGQLIKDTWGKYPLNMFGSTEAGYIASQTWDYGTMTFNPSMNFLEFIPESECEKCQQDNSYVPACFTLDEVKVGEKYELVISNFHGGPLIRYRTGDAIKIMALSNSKLGISLPQMEFVGRVDDRLDIGGFVRLTEKVIWQAISNTGIPYVDWAARKENGYPSRLYRVAEYRRHRCRQNYEGCISGIKENGRRLHVRKFRSSVEYYANQGHIITCGRIYQLY